MVGEYRVMADAAFGGVSAVTSALPSSSVSPVALGDAVFQSGIKYRLCCNASANSVANPGTILTPVNNGGAGAYSMTVTLVSQTFCHIGAALVVHSTVPTGNFFWGAVAGYGGLKVIGDNTSIPTGSAFYLTGATGTVSLFPQSIMTGNVVAGVNVGGAATKTVTTGAASGDILLLLD